MKLLLRSSSTWRRFTPTLLAALSRGPRDLSGSLVCRSGANGTLIANFLGLRALGAHLVGAGVLRILPSGRRLLRRFDSDHHFSGKCRWATAASASQLLKRPLTQRPPAPISRPVRQFRARRPWRGGLPGKEAGRLRTTRRLLAMDWSQGRICLCLRLRLCVVCPSATGIHRRSVWKESSFSYPTGPA